LTFYPVFYQSSQWPRPAHQTIGFVFIWPEVHEETREAVQAGTASWSVEIIGPNYGTQAYFEWQTSSTDIVNWESRTPSVALHAWPNPFNEVVQISYYLPSNASVTLTIFDLLGRRADKMHYPIQIAGWHRTSWEPNHLPSGIYFVRLEVTGKACVQKIQLVK
ncbi:MAG: T9SS type A sorting domain-containing protein, partial [Calditrichaeota bacterium]|nr:T9SS type A sorting domain-containing protein [Calditrichota bacterium]